MFVTRKTDNPCTQVGSEVKWPVAPKAFRPNVIAVYRHVSVHVGPTCREGYSDDLTVGVRIYL